MVFDCSNEELAPSWRSLQVLRFRLSRASPEPSQIARQASQTAVEAPSQGPPRWPAPAAARARAGAAGELIRTPRLGAPRPTARLQAESKQGPSRNPAQPLQPPELAPGTHGRSSPAAAFPRIHPARQRQEPDQKPATGSVASWEQAAAARQPTPVRACRPQNSLPRNPNCNPRPPNPALLLPSARQPYPTGSGSPPTPAGAA